MYFVAEKSLKQTWLPLIIEFLNWIDDGFHSEVLFFFVFKNIKLSAVKMLKT